MPKKSLCRKLVDGSDLRNKIQAGVDIIHDVALASYGCRSGNVLIENRYGEPIVSHDGITNIASLTVDDSIANSAISIIRQASSKTDTKAGDATTLTILLACLAYEYWSERVESGEYTIRQSQLAINNIVSDIIESIENGGISADELTYDDLKNIAIVSAGDANIGEMIASAVSEVGVNGSVTVTEHSEPYISLDIISGLTFKNGLKAVALAKDLQTIKTIYDKPNIIVMPKVISKNDEILPILDMMLRAGKDKILLIADVTGQALETIVANKMSGKLDIAVVSPVATNRDEFITDVAFYAGTVPFVDRPDKFSIDEYVGTVETATITMTETVLNGSSANVDEYCKNISDNRREMLMGKTAKILVGASTVAERTDLKLRIDDAVCAVRTAQTDGAVSGGGVMLRDVSSKIFYEHNMKLEYLAKPYEYLTGKDFEYELGTTLLGNGYNIENNMFGNMREMGILDSKKAIIEAVKNAHSAASQLISIKVALPFVEDME